MRGGEQRALEAEIAEVWGRSRAASGKAVRLRRTHSTTHQQNTNSVDMRLGLLYD